MTVEDLIKWLTTFPQDYEVEHDDGYQINLSRDDILKTVYVWFD